MMDERRKEQRCPVRAGAFVWQEPDLVFRSVAIVEVSRSGMRLESDHAFGKGRLLCIDFRGMIVCGTVAYCVPAEKGFAAEIRIEEVLDRVIEETVNRGDRARELEPAGSSAL